MRSNHFVHGQDVRNAERRHPEDYHRRRDYENEAHVRSERSKTLPDNSRHRQRDYYYTKDKHASGHGSKQSNRHAGYNSDVADGQSHSYENVPRHATEHKYENVQKPRALTEPPYQNIPSSLDNAQSQEKVILKDQKLNSALTGKQCGWEYWLLMCI